MTYHEQFVKVILLKKEKLATIERIYAVFFILYFVTLIISSLGTLIFYSLSPINTVGSKVIALTILLLQYLFFIFVAERHLDWDSNVPFRAGCSQSPECDDG